MATTIQRVDKDTFKQIFRDHWGTFQQGHPRYQDRHVQAVIEKMLSCGTLEAGYTTYLCPHCLAEKRVACSCKSSFCLSCCKVYVDEWVAHIGRTLYEGVAYRHVVLTMPDALHRECYRDRPLLADLMQCGVAMLSDALSWFTKVKLEAGYVVVLETAGRSGHWNPHLHILMTSGGMTPQQQWREVDDFPFTVLHKKWQYHLFTMLKQRVGTRALKDKIDVLWRKYPRGLVAYLEEGKVPAGGEGLAYYLATYVVSPPISLRRLLSYDGQRVRYWYNDHKTKQRQEEEVSALTFIGRMVQHMLPKGFHRMRYYGLHATCTVKQVKGLRTMLMVALGRLIKGTYRIAARTTYRDRVLASTGRDPLRCTRCGGEMMLGKVWHPRDGVIYNELHEIKRGRYGPRRGIPPDAKANGDGDKPMIQLALTGLRV
jgi:hypothetical protein